MDRLIKKRKINPEEETEIESSGEKSPLPSPSSPVPEKEEQDEEEENEKNKEQEDEEEEETSTEEDASEQEDQEEDEFTLNAKKDAIVDVMQTCLLQEGKPEIELDKHDKKLCHGDPGVESQMLLNQLIFAFGDDPKLREKYVQKEGRCSGCKDDIDFEDGGPLVSLASHAGRATKKRLVFHCAHCSK